MSQGNWDLAGYTAPSDGSLGRPVPSGKIKVPANIWLDGDVLRWGLGGSDRDVEPSRATINDFLKLKDASPASILAFAQKWGVLVLTNENTPRPCGESMLSGAESIDAWRYYAGRATAILNIAAAVTRGKLGDLDDWRALGYASEDSEEIGRAVGCHRFGLPMWPPPQWSRDPLDAARDCIAREVEAWFSFWKDRKSYGLSDFGMAWNPDAKRWELRINFHGFLFAAIAMQLALVIAEADSLYSCSGCGMPYIRTKKRPKAGSANYCDSCTAKGKDKERAANAYRQKKAQAIQLHSHGILLPEIAAQLNTEPARIQKWIKKGQQHVETKTRKR
jgi:transposase-like protein